MRGADLKSTHRARALRRRSTRAEWVLWLALRDRRLGGSKFARQQPVGRYCADFVCREQRLIIWGGRRPACRQCGRSAPRRLSQCARLSCDPRLEQWSARLR